MKKKIVEKKEKNKVRNEKAITLIALVITIIVILIMIYMDAILSGH